MPSLPEYVTIPQAIERWGVGKDKLRSLIRKGELKAYRPAKDILIDVDSGDSWWRRSGEKLLVIPKDNRRRIR